MKDDEVMIILCISIVILNPFGLTFYLPIWYLFILKRYNISYKDRKVEEVSQG